jgi:hypothetical protein
LPFPVSESPRLLQSPQQVAFHRDPFSREKAANLIHVALALLLQLLEFAMLVPVVFVLSRRHMHDSPDIVITSIVAHEIGEQLCRVDSVSLRSPTLPAHLHARGIHHQALNPKLSQEPMWPESVSSRFQTTQHTYVRSKTELLLRPIQDRHQFFFRSRRHHPGVPLPASGRTQDSPLFLAQLKCYVQFLLGRIPCFVGRRLLGHLLPPLVASRSKPTGTPGPRRRPS